MSRLFLQMVGFFAFFFVFTACNEKESSSTQPADKIVKNNPNRDQSINLPQNFEAVVVADSVGRARHIAVNDNGDIYVQLRHLKAENGIVVLRDSDGDGRANIIERFGEHKGTGMAIHNGYLYCSSDIEVFRYPLKEGTLAPSEDEKELIVGGFIDQSQHASKSFTLDNEGNLYVNVGAPSNACMKEARTNGSPGLDPCPQLERQAGIWQFKADETAQDQVKDGMRYATGIRNAVAIEWNSSTNSLFVLQHGRDQLSQFFPELFDETANAELPSEEFLEVQEGDDFGWPYCYFDQIQNKKILAPEYGGDGQKQGRCESIKPPIVAFPGHIAPNDLVFYKGNQFPEKYQNGAFIAFHGSWNRAPKDQEGYYVVFVPFQNGKPSGDWEVFADSFSGKKLVKAPHDAKFRPTGLSVGPDGALYVADSVKGKIWKIVYK
ncbi:MAG: sorbosone dehydrogenase [Bacteroidetes bacterium]|nr:sorbosone dehydrogenase [Bacteroidota bacterium]